MDKVEIYALKCPTTNEVRYIGKANDSKKRLSSHLRDSKRRKTPVYDWINSLALKGLVPEFEVILLTTADSWKIEEVRLISEYRLSGCNLLNVAIGGDEPFCPREVRAANGKKNAKDLHSDQKRKRMWRARQALASNLYWLETHGRTEKAKEVRERLLSKGIFI